MSVFLGAARFSLLPFAGQGRCLLMVNCSGQLNSAAKTEKYLSKLLSSCVHSFNTTPPIKNQLWTACSNTFTKRISQQDQHRSSFPPPGGSGGILFCGLLGFSLRELLGETEEEPVEPEDSPLTLMIKRGILAFHLSEFDNSERLLHLALKVAQELEDDKVVTYIYDVLANLAFQREDYDKAEKLFKSVLQRHVEDGGDVYGNVFVAVSLKLAHCFAARGDYNNAIMGFHYCIASQNQKIRPCPSDGPPTPATSTDGPPPASAPPDEDTIILWAMSVEQYAHLLLHLGRYQPAREQLQEALAVCRQVMGDMHLQTAVLRNDIGTIYSMEKRYDEAAEEIEQAISIVQSHIQAEEERAQNEPEETKPPIKVGAYPIPHADNPQGNLAAYHINLGSVQLLRGRLKSARRSCEEGARVAKRGSDAEGLQEAAQCLRTVKEAVEERAARRAKNETAPIKAQA